MTAKPAGYLRTGQAWTGIGLLALITVMAVATFGLDLVRALRLHALPGVLPGLALTAIAAVGFVAIMAGLRRWARSGRRNELLGLAIGLTVLLALRGLVSVLVDAPLDGEMHAYDTLANAIPAGACCFSDRPMGYPLALSASYALFGRDAFAGEILNIALALICGVLLWILARRVAGPRTATMTLMLYALWPAGALMILPRLTETAYTAVLLLSVIAALGFTGARGSVRTGRGLLAGALIGLSEYVRPTSIALVPAFLVAMLGGRRPRAVALAKGLALVGACLIVLAPAIVHNLQAHGELTPATSSYGGQSLYIGTDQKTGGRLSNQILSTVQGFTPGGAWQDGQVAAQIGLARIEHDPLGFLVLAARKVPTLWATEDYGVNYGIRRGSADRRWSTFPTLASQGFYVGITALATLGLYINRRRLSRFAILTIGLVATVTLVHAVLEVRDRYHMYLVPLLILLAANAWAADLPRQVLPRLVGLKQRPARRMAPPALSAFANEPVPAGPELEG